jgi:homoserine dehydrogenase
MKAINIGLIGFGNIGTGVVSALHENASLLQSRVGAPLRITRIADVDTVRRREVPYDPSTLTNQAQLLLEDPDIQIIVELVGGLEPARTFVETALRNGKHVVTANKAMLATFGAELWALAAKNNVALLFEASVGGGIPIIRALQLGLSANRIRSVYGIVNGTCNYILTHMSRDRKAFETVLAEAQAHGFAEPDPTYDIEGYDTAHKTAVLASLAFQQDVRFTDVFVEGITRIRSVDIEYAAELGYTIKLLGIAKSGRDDGMVEVRVHPTLLPKDALLAHVNDVFNAIMVEGDLVGKTMFYGRGAGPNPTASAVLSDVASIAASIVNGSIPSEHRLAVPVGEKNLMPISQLETSYYVRMTASDQPGVMARLSGALGGHNVSIKSMIQKGREEGGTAEVIIVTHKAAEKNLQDALMEIATMDIIHDQPFVLRVEENL